MAPAQADPFREAYQAMLDAAAPVAQVQTAYAAEYAISVLMGGVYSLASESDRRGQIHEFVDNFVKFLGRRRSVEALVTLAGLSGVAPGPGADRAGRAVQRFAERDMTVPRWVTHAGKVTCTGAWHVNDVFGDQTHYLIGYAYNDPVVGGPEHVVCALVDHNRGTVADLVVSSPASDVVDGWRETAKHTEGMVTVDPIEPAVARARVEPHLLRTEGSAPPGGQQFLDHWALLAARLNVLPQVPGERPKPLAAEARSAIVTSFLGSPEGQQATSALGPDVARAGAKLMVDYAVDANSGDPLRWSPQAAQLFMKEWVPAQSLPGDAAVWLPQLMDRFVTYAAHVKELPPGALAGTRGAIAQLAGGQPDTGAPGADPAANPDGSSGSTLDPAMKAEVVEQVLRDMMADGVDPHDDEAARRWLAEYLEEGNDQQR
ncbi:MAG: hypothetical protein ACRDTQ_02575 [Micromonosporaceae bacterium]